MSMNLLLKDKDGKTLDFDKFCEINNDELYCIFAESGADREFDYDAEDAALKLYEKLT